MQTEEMMQSQVYRSSVTAYAHQRGKWDYSELAKQADYTAEMLKPRAAPQHCPVAHQLKKNDSAA